MIFSNDNPLVEIYGVEDCFAFENKGTGQSLENVKLERVPLAVGDKASVMDGLKISLEGCRKCALGAGRKNLVFGEGNVNARLMFVGEGPGADEDATGRPFVGRSGQLLTKMIEAMGIKRSDVYIANIVKCRPPDNRNPFLEEAEACIENLKKQIVTVNPEYIVCLGSVAVSYLLKTTTPISKLRGQWQDFGNYKVMPTYHPSYLLRSPNKKSEAWQDLQLVMKELGLGLGK